MTHNDQPRSPLRSHRRPGVRRREHSQRCRIDDAARPRLRLVVKPPRTPDAFGMHPALPLTLVFAAFTLTALAFARAVDAANALARTAVAVGMLVHFGSVRAAAPRPRSNRSRSAD